MAKPFVCGKWCVSSASLGGPLDSATLAGVGHLTGSYARRRVTHARKKRCALSLLASRSIFGPSEESHGRQSHALGSREARLVSRFAGHFQDLIRAFALGLNADTVQLRLGIVHKLIDFGWKEMILFCVHPKNMRSLPSRCQRHLRPLTVA